MVFQVPHHPELDYVAAAMDVGILQEGFHSGVVDRARFVFGALVMGFGSSDYGHRPAFEVLNMSVVEGQIPQEHFRIGFDVDVTRRIRYATVVLQYWDSLKWLWGATDETIVYEMFDNDHSVGGRLSSSQEFTDAGNYSHPFLDPRLRKE